MADKDKEKLGGKSKDAEILPISPKVAESKKIAPPTEAELIQMRANRKTLAALGGLVLLAGVGTFSKSCEDHTDKKETPQATQVQPKIDFGSMPDVKFTPIPPFKPEGKNQIEELLSTIKHCKDLSVESVSQFKDADPQMPILIKFLEDNGYCAIPLGPVTTQKIKIPKPGEKSEDVLPGPKEFELVIMPEKYAANMAAPLMVENGGTTIRIAASLRRKEVLGILLGHALSNVYDLKILGENPNDPIQAKNGDVKAYRLEKNLLKAWSPEAFEFLIKKGTPLYKANKKPEFVQLVTQLYKLDPLPSKETSLMVASAFISIAVEEAEKKKASEAEFRNIIDEAGRKLGN